MEFELIKLVGYKGIFLIRLSAVYRKTKNVKKMFSLSYYNKAF